MENTRRNAYDAAFKLNAIDLVVREETRAAAHKLERRWRRQCEELTQSKRRQNLSEVIKADGPNLKTFLKTG